ncbi:hypothetical protein QQF64_007966 [Cirrhinus molitorella]|uniref:PiggyBac transposable element-derived protein domain-containing protein n=1 Tax=Cirrhinus molitorella TaxID=172907 RepID=A0ABR3M7X3_9TELE
MGLRRYEDTRRFIRFDDKRTRALRLETDHMAAFRTTMDNFFTCIPLAEKLLEQNLTIVGTLCQNNKKKHKIQPPPCYKRTQSRQANRKGRGAGSAQLPRQKSQQLVFHVQQTCVQGAQTCSCHL